MKIHIACFLALAAPFAMSGCVTVKTQKSPPSHVTSTTTEQTTVSHSRPTTVETQTLRSY